MGVVRTLLDAESYPTRIENGLRRQTIIYEYGILQWLALGLDTPHARFILVTILTIELETGSPNAA
jgi:hypothetical protein